MENITAEEMFEKLDFLRTTSKNNIYFISYEKQEERKKGVCITEEVFEIVFDKIEKKVYFNYYINNCETNFFCDLKLLNAIQKQIEELGWEV